MWWLLAGILLVVAVAIFDVTQRRRAILRNFPLIGHLRYILEAVGPELRQYIVTDNDSERPFSRDERRWIYSSAKGESNAFGFGTDNRFENDGDYLIVRHAAFPLDEPAAPLTTQPVPADACAKVLGGAHGRAKAFRPESIVNISAMSFGSLGSRAVETLNKGALAAGCWQNTGEGGLSEYHKQGGKLVLQVGTAYFGCRTLDGRFDLDRLVDRVESAPVVAIEIKLSQGAKPALGGLLPGAKVTPQIAQLRGIEAGRDCVSPARHTAFEGVDGLCEFVERIADRTGLPVGIKSAVGEATFWSDLAQRMAATGTGPDFITVDGGEGGTGAAPLVFADHVSLPYFAGFAQVYRQFAERGMADDVVFIGSGRLGLPERAIAAFSLGADMINVAREAMLAVGCIQAQRCQTGHCPTGVTTQSRWLQRGIDPTLKSARVANYVATLRYEIVRLAAATGVDHPSKVAAESVGMLSGGLRLRSLREIFEYRPGWGAFESDLSDWADNVARAHMHRPVIETALGDQPIRGSAVAEADPRG